MINYTVPSVWDNAGARFFDFLSKNSDAFFLCCYFTTKIYRKIVKLINYVNVSPYTPVFLSRSFNTTPLAAKPH